MADASTAYSQDMALRLAQKYGHDVEVVSQRSETSTTFALADGTLRLDSSVVPVRVHDNDGGWSAIDTTLIAGADGAVAPRSVTVPVQFSGGGSGPLARVQSEDGSWLSISWKQGELPTPDLDADSATYRDVFPDVDLRLTAGTEGFSEVLIVKSPQAAQNPELDAVNFGIDDGALITTTGRGASLTSTSTDGSVQLREQSPTWWDTSTGGDADGPGDHGVARPLIAASASPDTVTVDAGSVADTPGVHYPLYIDPSFTGSRQAYLFVDKAYPSENYLNGSGASDKYVHVGYVDGANSDDGKSHKTRGFFKMNTSSIRGTKILSAQFNVRLRYSFSCNKSDSATGVEAHLTSANEGFDSKTNWNNMPGVGGQQGDTVKAAYRSGCTNDSGYKPIGFDATDGVAYVARNNMSSANMMLEAADEGDNLSWKKFDNSPTLSVTYDRAPSTPSRLSIRPCYTQCTGNVISRPTASSSLKATAAASDPDGGNVRYLYQFFDSHSTSAPGTVNWQGWTPWVKSGTYYALTPPSSSVPVRTGGQWEYRVLAQDPSGEESGWSGWQQFTFDLTAPPAPDASISGASTDPDIADASRVGTVGSPVKMSFATSANSSAVEIVYSVAGSVSTFSAPPACNSGTGGVFVICKSGSTWPVQTIAARDEEESVQLVSFDAAGNRSSTGEVDLYVKPNLAAVNAGHSWQVDPTVAGTVSDSASVARPLTETSTVTRHDEAPNSSVVRDGELDAAQVTVQDFRTGVAPGSNARTSGGAVVTASQTFTMGGWFKTGSTLDTWQGAMSLRGTYVSTAWIQQSAHGYFRLCMFLEDKADSNSSTDSVCTADDTILAPNKWYFVATSWDAVNRLMTISVNGNPPTATYRATAGLASPNFVELGSAELTGNQPYAGSVFGAFVMQGLASSLELQELAGTADLGYPAPAVLDN